jgi:hypothetical protein
MLCKSNSPLVVTQKAQASGRSFLAALASLALLSLCPRPSQAQYPMIHSPFVSDHVITFDDVPDGTAINTYYPLVTFSPVGGTPGWAPTTGDIYARFDPFAESASNVVSLVPPYSPNDPTSSILPESDERAGKIQARFATLQMSVSIDALPILPPEWLGTPLNLPYLQAFDANGNLLGTAYYPYSVSSPYYGTWQRLTVTSATNNIAYVQFSCQHSQGTIPVYGDFDRLEFVSRFIMVPIRPYQPFTPFH